LATFATTSLPKKVEGATAPHGAGRLERLCSQLFALPGRHPQGLEQAELLGGK